jgi:PPM family protein phosphatase
MPDEKTTQVPNWLFSPSLRSPFDAPPPEVAVDVDFAAWSRPGPMRTVSEDHYLILRQGRSEETLMTSLPEGQLPRRFDEYGYAMVLADGLGGDGENASRLAVATLLHLAIYFGKGHTRMDEPIAGEIMDRALRFYRSIDATLSQAAYTRHDVLQTTLTAVYSVGRELFFAHVGHSRAYLLRGDQLSQLTRDHTVSLASARPGRPVLVTSTPSVRDLSHVLASTLGGTSPDQPRIDVERVGLEDGDIMMLCTNGLTDVVDDVRIADTLCAYSTPDDQGAALINLAVDAQAEDDITVLIARYHIG